ncbi:MAG: hypothetical protein HY049_11075 [Acidobacteria bacterium]|nr:hypothetical protein [Acidobacteriota bacterium]
MPALPTGPLRKLSPLALALLAAAGCAAPPSLPAGAAFLPTDSVFVLSMNLPTLTSTDLYRQLKESGGTVGLNRLNVVKFATAAGLDPFKDVKWLTFVGRKRGDNQIPIDELSAVASGFDGKKVLDYLKRSGLPSDPHAGIDIFPIVIVQDRCRFCVSVLDDTSAAFGDGETLKSMAETRAAGAAGLAGDESVRALLTRIDARAAVWGLVRGPNLAGALTEALAKIQTGVAASGPMAPVSEVAFFATAGENIVVAIEALAANHDDALRIADAIQGMGSVGQMALKQVKPEDSALLSSFRVAADGRAVRVSASVPQAKLVELASAATNSLFKGAFPGLN